MPSRRAFFSIASPRAISEREAAMPEEVGLLLALPAGFQAGNDLAEFGVERFCRKLADFGMGTQTAELAALALAPLIDDELVHDVGQREFDSAHRAVRNDESAVFDPARLYCPNQRTVGLPLSPGIFVPRPS